jgi:HD-GYP domain-containing protein (c-di-GMP phosphodiesterase class II)
VTGSVDDVLRDLQSAITVRQLYPSGHPRMNVLLEALERGARAITANRTEFSVFAMDGRVASEQAILGGGESLARGLFQTLRANGYHRLTIKQGVSRQEFEAFVAQMARSSRPTDPGAGLHSTEHIRLSALEPVSPDKSFAVLDVMAEGRERLPQLWSSVCDHRELDVEGIEQIGLALLRTLETQADAMIPLATLRNHDDYTVTHIANVALLAMALGEVANLRADAVRDLGLAALLHDIGKLSIPAEILGSQDRLTDEQFRIVRRHPEEGARILLETPGVPELAVLVAYEHHVQFDGGGYPTLPRGWRVNLASAITQIADVYDALRSNRPYRQGLGRNRIEEIMRRDAGTVFHPDLVAAFFDVVVPRTADQG